MTQPATKDDINKIVEENKAQIKALLPNEHPNVSYKDMEAINIILKDIHEESHVPSLTNLTRNEIDSVRTLRGFNRLAKNPLIAEDIRDFLDMKRSETKEPTNMLKGLFDIATQYVDSAENSMIRKMGLRR